MDFAACNVVYVDRTAGEDRLIRRDDHALISQSSVSSVDGAAASRSQRGANHVISRNLETLLEIFSEVYICTTGKACVSRLSVLNENSIIDLTPTLVLIDIPYEEAASDSRTETPSPTSSPCLDGLDPEMVDASFYGLALLQWISSDIQQHNISKLIVPVAVVTLPDSKKSLSQRQEPAKPISPKSQKLSQHGSLTVSSITTALDQQRTMRYLDVGAVDVLTSPLLHERLPSLAIHAYRSHKESLNDQKNILDLKKGRKRSWVGLDDQKPYAYLREAMVSGLMDGICRSGAEPPLPIGVQLSISEDRQDVIESAIGTWYFSAQDFTEDELVLAAMLMLQHALTISELEQWRIPTDSLKGFLVACRAAYNSFVPYHNFRHVIDVMQASFYFLVRLGALPPYAQTPSPEVTPIDELKSPVAKLLRPFDALTLLITAIGHDVGHPGVNNAFLVTLNAPLAQLYNDRSVLESFHCAAYSQILRRHWPAAFAAVEMRKLMISSILATDMGLHFDYMKKLGFLQEKLPENGGADGWNGRLREEYRTLACSLIIKCADISNVARRYDIAAKWTMILTDEFSRQASMEADLGIPSALFAPPVREVIEVGKSQIGFINMFALPLFQGITDVMPAMKFCVDELNKNVAVWTERIEIEQARLRKDSEDSLTKDGMLSPRAMSVATSFNTMSQQKPGISVPQSRNPSDATSENSHQAIKNSMKEDDFKFNVQVGGKKLSSVADMDAEVKYSGAGLPSMSSIPAAYSLTQNASSSSSGQPPLNYTSASAPSLLDHTSHVGDLNGKSYHANKISIETSQITDAATDAVTQQTSNPRATHFKSKPQNRSSENTDGSGSNSQPGSNDWGSQATSATTSKLPLSPSTQGTSIVSDDEYAPEKAPSSFMQPLLQREPGLNSAPQLDVLKHYGPMGSETFGPLGPMTHIRSDGSESKTSNGSSVTILETMRSLAKKPSRSRFRFWKKAKGGEPPMPTPNNTYPRGEHEQKMD